MATKYKVGNPRGIAEGIQILTWTCTIPDPDEPDPEFARRIPRGSMKEDILWFEGDDFERPEGMSDKAFKDRLASGFIYEVVPTEASNDED